jgi:hypothetical protein
MTEYGGPDVRLKVYVKELRQHALDLQDNPEVRAAILQDADRISDSIDQIRYIPRSKAEMAYYEKRRLDMLQGGIAIFLLVALVTVLVMSILRGSSSESVGQWTSPISGLAGIAIGYLFSSRFGPTGPTPTDEAPPPVGG